MRAQRFNFADLSRPATGKQGEVGWYWDPQGSGRGIGFEVQNNVIFMAMFHYSADGTATWNSTATSISADGRFSGDFEVYSAGQVLLDPFRGPPFRLSPAGTIAGTFSDSCNATFTLPGNIPLNLTRFPIGAPSADAACRTRNGQIPTTAQATDPVHSLLNTSYYSGVTAAQNLEFRKAIAIACASPFDFSEAGLTHKFYDFCLNTLPSGYPSATLTQALERGGLPRRTGLATMTGPSAGTTFSVLNMPFTADQPCSFAMTNAATPSYDIRAAGSAFLPASTWNFNGKTNSYILLVNGVTSQYNVSTANIDEEVSVAPDNALVNLTPAPGQTIRYRLRLNGASVIKEFYCKSQ